MIEKETSLGINEAYEELKKILLKEGFTIVKDDPPKSLIVEQGSLKGYTPKTIKKIINFDFIKENSRTKIISETSLKSKLNIIELFSGAFSLFLISALAFWIASVRKEYIKTFGYRYEIPGEVFLIINLLEVAGYILIAVGIGFIIWASACYFGRQTIATETLNLLPSPSPSPSPPPPSFLSWSNDVTKNDSLSISITLNQSINFTAITNQPCTNWLWNIEGSVIEHVYPTPRTKDNLAWIFKNPGNHKVTLNANNKNGSTKTLTWNIAVNPPPPLKEEPSLSQPLSPIYIKKEQSKKVIQETIETPKPSIQHKLKVNPIGLFGAALLIISTLFLPWIEIPIIGKFTLLEVQRITSLLIIDPKTSSLSFLIPSIFLMTLLSGIISIFKPKAGAFIGIFPLTLFIIPISNLKEFNIIGSGYYTAWIGIIISLFSDTIYERIG
jgi:hypothetical protein